jgi:hypothetical protein
MKPLQKAGAAAIHKLRFYERLHGTHVTKGCSLWDRVLGNSNFAP